MSARIKSVGGKETAISLDWRVLDVAERRKRALKALGIFWGLSVATAPLPPIHWVTVPFFFFFGIYQGVRKWRYEKEVLPFSFACPECQKEVKVPATSPPTNWQVICPSCRYGLVVMV